MDVVGSEIGQKMRSAIKAKLTELGCYVDDELPDYVMVMVANKRTRGQMEDDLQLFLGDNTEQFVNWLHQVLKKLQEVTVTAPKIADSEKNKERSQSKERKSKEKKTKEKVKKSDVKKSKKKEKEKEKEKSGRKKDDKKVHKSKKKSKHHEMIRPNVPPLLMNMEKESEPSITDVFAGQILKNHGITLDTPKEDVVQEIKPVVKEVKRPILPIIDPSTIPSQTNPLIASNEPNQDSTPAESTNQREDQIKEINEIEAKIQGLKQKLVEQLDSMSEDDEDFLNIRTEAEELMNDFAEDVFQEISSQATVSTPPLLPASPPMPTPPLIEKSPSPIPPSLIKPKPIDPPKDPPKDPPETLPQIELNLPKRPVRERLGAREEPKKISEAKQKEDKRTSTSPERFTPEKEPEIRPQQKSAKSRLGDPPEPQKRNSASDDTSDKSDTSTKRLSSRVSVLESSRPRTTCASVVRVRPRPRVPAPASSLLLRAVADAHKSLLNIPPKVDPEPQKVKRALVLPMRRCVDAQKIVIQVPADTNIADTDTDRNTDTLSLDEQDDSEDDKSSKVASDTDRNEYVPTSITKKIVNTDYVPSRRNENRTTSKRDDTLIIETINIHNPTVDKDKNTQFIVTMDGYHPNAFLAKKLLTEGLLNDDDEEANKKLKSSKTQTPEKSKVDVPDVKTKETESTKCPNTPPKRVNNNMSADNNTQTTVKKEEEKAAAKRKSSEVKREEVTPVKKRRASPIVFDVDKKERDKDIQRERERTESASSDNHVTVTTINNSHKYDSVPPLTQPNKQVWCRSFPLCRYGSACAFQHPRCKFAAACTRRNCVYSHSLNAPLTPPLTLPSVASHVVPAANYKTISTAGLPGMCKYYPNCANPACHYYHPKPCRYGKNCANKLECNFFHADVPAAKWRYPV